MNQIGQVRFLKYVHIFQGRWPVLPFIQNGQIIFFFLLIWLIPKSPNQQLDHYGKYNFKCPCNCIPSPWLWDLMLQINDLQKVKDNSDKYWTTMVRVKQVFSNLPSSLTQTVDPSVCNQLVRSASHCQVNIVSTLMSERTRIRFCQKLTLLLETISAD